MGQNQKTFNTIEKELDCFSACLVLSGYKGIETPITQHDLQYTLENRNIFEKGTLSTLMPNDIIVFLEMVDGLYPYKHAYVVKNSKRETLLTRPIKGQKVTLTNLSLEMKRKKTGPYKVRIYRIKSEDDVIIEEDNKDNY